MEEARLKKLTIEYDVETGHLQIDGVRTDGKPAEKRTLSADEQKKIHESPNGFKFVGLILHYHMSPGCGVVIGGSNIHLC